MKIKRTFVAADGVEFQTREECIRHEERNSADKYREKYYDTLCEINYMKRRTFKKLDRDLAKARDAYRIAKQKGVAGSKSFRFEKLTELRSAYVEAKHHLKEACAEYGILRRKLCKLGVLLGFRKSILRAQKEKQLKGDEK